MKNIKHKRNIKIGIKNTVNEPSDNKYEEKKRKSFAATIILVIVLIMSLTVLFFSFIYTSQPTEIIKNTKLDNEVSKTNEVDTEVYLFIFNFHWNKYEGYPFIRDVYIPYIQKTFQKKCEFVFYGPSDSDIYPIKNNSLMEGGYTSYYTLVKAYEDIKSTKIYDGYFILNDDSFFDPIVFYRKGFNLNYPIVEQMGTFPKDFKEWLWPDADNGKGITYRQAYVNVRNIICNSSASSSKSIGYNNTKFMKLCQFDSNQNFHGYADFFYVPKNLIEDFVYLYDLAYKEGMFLEMAVNAFNYNYEHQELGKKCFFISELGTCPHVHPIKYSFDQNRRITEKYIKKVLRYLNSSKNV